MSRNAPYAQEAIDDVPPQEHLHDVRPAVPVSVWGLGFRVRVQDCRGWGDSQRGCRDSCDSQKVKGVGIRATLREYRV